MMIKTGACVMMDLGSGRSLSSSLYLAQKVARVVGGHLCFIMRRKHAALAQHFDKIHFFYIEDSDHRDLLDRAYSVVDFTAPGEGQSRLADQAPWIHRFHWNLSSVENDGVLHLKAEFVEEHFGLAGLLQSSVNSETAAPVLTYSADTAAFLNMLGLPTIELCHSYRNHGSFLPGSLIVRGEKFEELHREELDMIFHLYKSNQIDRLFLNRGVLEVPWTLTHLSSEKETGRVLVRQYPMSDTEIFMDQFFRNFLIIQASLPMEDLMATMQKMDSLDLEMTMAFLRKALQKCLDDVEYECFPFTDSHWNFVRPYVDCSSRKSLTPLHRSLTRALLGLEMVEKILQRRRKVLSLH